MKDAPVVAVVALVVALTACASTPGMRRLRAAEGVFVGLIAWQFVDDRFEKLSAFADKVEHAVPVWLQYDKWGDPASWAHHGLWTLAVGGLGAGVAKLAGVPVRTGFCDFTSAWVLGFYVPRELNAALDPAPGRGPIFDRRTFQEWQRGYHAGWAIDGTLDVAVPALVACRA